MLCGVGMWYASAIDLGELGAPIILFFSLEPEWAAAATEVKEQTKGKVKLAAVDATVNQMLANRYGVSVLCSDGIFFSVPGKPDFPSVLLILTWHYLCCIKWHIQFVCS